MTERHFEFAPAILPRNGNVDDERAWAFRLVGDENNGGPGFGGHAMSTNQTSPWRRFICRPRMSSFSCSTSREGSTSAQSSCARWRSRIQVMENLAHHRFGLVPNFFDQRFPARS